METTFSIDSMVVCLLLSLPTIACDTEDPSAAAEANEEVVRTYMQAYNDRDMEAMGAVMADELELAGSSYTREEYLTMIESTYWVSFPDMRFVGEPMVVGTPNYVTVHTDIEATGSGEFAGHDIDGVEGQSSEMMLFTVQDGQIQSYRYNWDELGFLIDLGVVEDPYATR